VRVCLYPRYGMQHTWQLCSNIRDIYWSSVRSEGHSGMEIFRLAAIQMWRECLEANVAWNCLEIRESRRISRGSNCAAICVDMKSISIVSASQARRQTTHLKENIKRHVHKLSKFSGLSSTALSLRFGRRFAYSHRRILCSSSFRSFADYGYSKTR
jgi:hypothetical protein